MKPITLIALVVMLTIANTKALPTGNCNVCPPPWAVPVTSDSTSGVNQRGSTWSLYSEALPAPDTSMRM